MKTTLNDIIRRMRVISDLENDESHEIKRMYGLGPNEGLEVGSETYVGIISEPSPVEGALTGFLDSLPTNLLSAIVVLMYAGRDNDKDIFKAIIRLKHIWDSKEHSIHAITEKSPRMEYIDKGFQKLKTEDNDKFIASFSKS